MEVILLSDVDHVGLRGDVVSVARGYARNYLLPRRLAEEATPARVAELQKRDVLRARHEAKTADQATPIAQLTFAPERVQPVADVTERPEPALAVTRTPVAVAGPLFDTVIT